MKLSKGVLMLAFILCLFFINTKFAENSGANLKLRKLAESKGILLGAAVRPEYLDESDYVDVLTNNFNYITPENHMKWVIVHPKKETYDFSGADKIVDFALKNKMKVRGHTLAWHYQNPDWLVSTPMKRAEAEKILKEHIMKVVGRYKGKIRDWDVVNEPLDSSGEIRVNIWSLTIGPEYIELAFKWAHEADPGARLFLNEYGNEWLGTKADAFYKLVKELKEKGVPINGVGLQCHIDGEYMPDFGSIAQNLKLLSELGLEIQITELDVRLRGTPTEKGISQHAKIYGELMKAALAYGCTAYITWGVSDKYSWIPSFFGGYGYGLLFDEKYQPKPAALAVHDVLSGEKPTKGYFEKFVTGTLNSRALPTFRAIKAKRVPVIDGKINQEEWKDTYVYPLIYNQLDVQNFNPPSSQKDIYGTWRIMFQGSKIFGLVTRNDDVTVTNHKNPWDNDNFELFYNIDGKWKQIRTIVGQNWQENNFVNGKAVWSKDGSILEFVVDVGVDLTGKTLGWSAALSDNDNPQDPLRKCQLYPIVGNNTGWQGKGFGEMTFQNDQGQFVDGPAIGAVMLYAASFASKPPILDGDSSDSQWKDAVSYPFAYNHYSIEQVVPFTGNYPGSFKLLSSGKAIYGLIQLSDTEAEKYDSVEFAFSIDGNTVVLTTEEGKDFDKSSWKKPAKAVWSKDRKTIEFMVEVSTTPISGKKGRFSIGIFGKKDSSGKRATGLFPFCGYNRIEQGSGEELGDIMSKKEIELADILCQ